MKRPFSCPNSSLSRSDSASAAQCSDTNGCLARGPSAWIARASSPLPGAALSGDEHRRAGGRDLARDAVHLLHRGARADEPLEPLAVALADLPAQILGLDAKLAALERALDGDDQGVEVDRLREVVLGAPARIACTAVLTSPNAVQTMTGTLAVLLAQLASRARCRPSSAS